MTAKLEDCDMPCLFDGHGNESGRMPPERLSGFICSGILQCRLLVILELTLKYIIYPFFLQPVIGSTQKKKNPEIICLLIIIII